MCPSQVDVINTKMHEEAENYAKEIIENFAVNLLLRAKSLASTEKAGLVINTHIDKAYNSIIREKTKTRQKDIRLAVSGVLLGTAAQGFVTELSVEPLRAFWITVYVVAGIIGIILLNRSL